MNKIILTDVDGVLTDWVTGFRKWMGNNGWRCREDYTEYYTIEKWYNITYAAALDLVIVYNASAAIGFLPAYLDSVQYVTRLHDEGYEFHAISSFGLDEYAHRLREMNIHELFGANIFKSFEFLDSNADKIHVLQQYKGTGHWWIEDKPMNAIAGHTLGLKSILMDHGHNSDHAIPNEIIRAENWEHIYKVITND